MRTNIATGATVLNIESIANYTPFILKGEENQSSPRVHMIVSTSSGSMNLPCIRFGDKIEAVSFPWGTKIIPVSIREMTVNLT